ncbi:Serine-rich protein-related [Melia azedarach]|uniref:Serine-rich protein-related n=1 Tax=Melia azedarach TaxID=155640 RepID=A0ACC1Y7J3_MELAZ|nr:Serine-rich protein-related [Melia azedarach]
MATKNSSTSSSSLPARTCLCSPSTHPGSFRCSLHRSCRKVSTANSRTESKKMMMSMASKADLIKAFLMQIIKPSSHNLRRRSNFQPKPTRFCQMNSRVAVS